MESMNLPLVTVVVSVGTGTVSSAGGVVVHVKLLVLKQQVSYDDYTASSYSQDDCHVPPSNKFPETGAPPAPFRTSHQQKPLKGRTVPGKALC